MSNSAIDDALDVAFVALCTIVTEVWLIGLGYLFHWVWSRP